MAENKESGSNWNTYVALSTAAMAVLAALTTLYMGKFSSRTVLAQMQESDNWAFYQAKSIKQHTFDLQRQGMELEMLKEKSRMTRDVAAKYKKVAQGYAEQVKKYDSEKKEIKTKAEEFAKEKQVSQERGGKFAFGLIFLQIAIMLSSISIITKKKPLWYFGIALSCVGVFYFLDGFLLFY